jgi:hypothetical protein
LANTDVAIATMTLARDEREADGLIGALTALADYGLPIFVADGGSVPPFLDRLQDIPHVTVTPYRPHGRPRLLHQVKTAVAEASATSPRYILYTEPDKAWFFQHRLWQFMTHAFWIDEPGVVLASRDGQSFGTFPRGQQVTEALTNRLAAEVLGPEGDYSYGPLLLRTDVACHLAGLTDDVGWGWRFYVMAVAHRMAAGLRHVTIDLPCPPEQRDENDLSHRLYRMEQMAQNVRGLALGLKLPLERDS